MPQFKVISEYTPSGDQPQAIEKLAEGLENGLRQQVLLGVTGSGKTYTMAAASQELKRMGLASKSLFSVPKHLVGQWSVEYMSSTRRRRYSSPRKRTSPKSTASASWDASLRATGTR